MKGRLAGTKKRKGSVDCGEFEAPQIDLVLNDFDGREISVTLVEYIPETKPVEVTPAVGERTTLPLWAFDYDARTAILCAERVQAFSKMTLQMKANKLDKEECEQCGVIFGRKGSSTYTYDGVSYGLTFKNRMLIGLDDLEVKTR